jgi:hypothetical protein
MVAEVMEFTLQSWLESIKYVFSDIKSVFRISASYNF